VDDLLSASLLFLFLGGTVFSWLDWRRRARRLGPWAGPSWGCPNCSIVNDHDAVICWACGAGIAGRVFHGGRSTPVESWQCGKCRAYNGMSRRSCWSCSNAPAKAPKPPA
jgi:hypothetical protein